MGCRTAVLSQAERPPPLRTHASPPTVRSFSEARLARGPSPHRYASSGRPNITRERRRRTRHPGTSAGGDQARISEKLVATVSFKPHTTTSPAPSIRLRYATHERLEHRAVGMLNRAEVDHEIPSSRLDHAAKFTAELVRSTAQRRLRRFEMDDADTPPHFHVVLHRPTSEESGNRQPRDVRPAGVWSMLADADIGYLH